MSWILVAVALCAAPDAKKVDPPRVVKLGAPGFTSANVTPEVTQVASDHFAQQLSLHALRVVTASEISALLGLERQKQLLGCADDTSCMVELSNALGVDGLVTGSIGSFGGRYTVNVKIVSAKDGAQLALFSGTAESERGLPDVLSRAAREVAEQVKVSLGLVEKPAPVARRGPAFTSRQKWALVPGIVGVLAFIGGGSALGTAGVHSSELEQLNAAVENAHLKAFELRNTGTVQRNLGWTGVIVGAVSVGLAAWLFFGGEEPTVAALPLLVPGAAGLSVAGSLPW